MGFAGEQQDRRMRKLFLSAVVLPLALAALAGAALAFQIGRLSAAADFIDASDRVIALAHEVQRLLGDQELGVRAYLFTGNTLFLDRYQNTDPDDDFDELDQLLADQPAVAAEARALRDEYRAYRAQTDTAVAHPAENRSVAAMRDRRASLDALRDTGAAIITQEKATRLDRTRRFERRTQETTLGAVTALLLLAGAAARASRRQIRLIAAASARERVAVHEAEEALHAKDAFLATLSHELRTPLTPILAWARMARARPRDGEIIDRALAFIERNAEAEARIVDDVLDISRIARGELRLAPEEVDAASVVRAAIDAVAVPARAKGIAVEATIASPLPPILGDPQRLQQVFGNLLRNAVKFTPRGGRVEVRAEQAGERLRVRVTDDGAGIAPDFLPHVFEEFRQADASMTRAYGGLGLGLAIVKHVVEMHGGEVRAASEGPGRGATFTVTLPALA